MNHNVAIASAAISVVLIAGLLKKKKKEKRKKKRETKEAMVFIAIIQKLVVEYTSFVTFDV